MTDERLDITDIFAPENSAYSYLHTGYFWQDKFWGKYTHFSYRGVWNRGEHLSDRYWAGLVDTARTSIERKPRHLSAGNTEWDQSLAILRCDRKAAHETYESAQLALEYEERRNGKQYVVYVCHDCGAYHVGGASLADRVKLAEGADTDISESAMRRRAQELLIGETFGWEQTDRG